ncbi:MAG: tetratricopeptide repeat protein [Clostridia bacterium]|nr:tetratricopeptide repeat protein [Clostridia bacterium]
MGTHDKPLAKEDYAEPVCLLCDPPYGREKEVKPVPQMRIIRKMDEYMSRRDYAGAERHLLYWLEEARLGNDERGMLLVCNELVGHYRKTGSRESAFKYASMARELLEKMDFDGTISSGTTYVNIGTAYNAFGENEEAEKMFEKAESIYSACKNVRPDLLGGLYNNMALVNVSLKRYEKACTLYEKALQTMKQVKGGELEQAITYLNMANAVEAEKGLDAGESVIFDYVDRAYDLLKNTSAPRDGYYAFVCEKCAPSFGYYGYFAAAEELAETAREIYERA